MKIKDSIQKNQIDILQQMGYGIISVKFSHEWNNGITYHIDFDKDKINYHTSIVYDWNKNEVSIQIIFDSNIKTKNKKCNEEKDFHSFVINYIASILS